MCLFSPRDWKNCATCQFWSGPRQFVQARMACQAGPRDCGTCALRGDQRRYVTNSCIAWRLWDPLEKTADLTAAAL